MLHAHGQKGGHARLDLVDLAVHLHFGFALVEEEDFFFFFMQMDGDSAADGDVLIPHAEHAGVRVPGVDEDAPAPGQFYVDHLDLFAVVPIEHVCHADTLPGLARARGGRTG